MSCENCKCAKCTGITKLQKQFSKFNYAIEDGYEFGFEYKTFSKNGMGSVIYSNNINELINHIEKDRGW